jgi:hypothetical protein
MTAVLAFGGTTGFGTSFEAVLTVPNGGIPRQGSPMSVDLVSKAKLMALLRRFMMEHSKSASRSICHCPICVDARKLLEQAFDEK